MKPMKNDTREKRIWALKAAAAVLAVALYAAAAVAVKAGPEKTGGAYNITDDSFTASGATDITGGLYWVVFSAGQAIGHEDMAGAAYGLEGGFISGVIPVFQVAKSISNVEAPPAYAGGPTDQVPGSRLTYKLDFENFGEGASNVLLEDAVPSNSTYYSGSIELILNNVTTAQSDILDGDPCAYQAATSSIHCRIPGVGAGATGAVIFKAAIN